MPPSLRPFVRSRRLLALSVLAWLMLVTGSANAALATASMPASMTMTMSVPACADAVPARHDHPTGACCHDDIAMGSCPCHAVASSVLLPLASVPVMATAVATAVPTRLRFRPPPERPSGPPLRPPQA